VLSPQEEREIVEAVQRGLVQPFARLVTAYQGALFGFARRLCRNAAEAEDAVQEAFVRAYVGIGAFDGSRKFSTWLYAICLNVLRDGRRRRAVRGEAVDIDEAGLADETAAPPEAAARGEQGRMLEQALERLPEPLREAVVLRFLQGLCFADVARVLGVSENAARKRTYQGLLRLHDLLPRDWRPEE